MEPTLVRGPLTKGVEALAKKDFLPYSFVEDFRKTLSRRNEIVHGVGTIKNQELKSLIAQVEGLIEQVPGANC